MENGGKHTLSLNQGCNFHGNDDMIMNLLNLKIKKTLNYHTHHVVVTNHPLPRASKAAWRSGPNRHWLAFLRWDSTPNAEIRGTSSWVIKGRHFGGGGGWRTEHHFRVNIPMSSQFWLIIVSQTMKPREWHPFPEQKSQVVSTINLRILQVHLQLHPQLNPRLLLGCGPQGYIKWMYDWHLGKWMEIRHRVYNQK